MPDDIENPDDSSGSEDSSDESSDETSSGEGGGEKKEEEDPKDKSGYGKEWKPEHRYKYVPGKGWEEDKEAEEEGPERKVTIYQHSWGDKHGYIGGISKEGETEGEYGSGKAGIGLFYGKAEAASELSYDLNKKEANLTLITAKAQISVVHADAEGKFKLGAWISSLFSGPEKKPADEGQEGQGQSGMAGMGALMAARVGDLTTHGSPLFPGIGSTNVFIGGMPAWRTLMDFHACPVVKGIIPDVGGVVMMGSPTVFINFMMACRIADMVVEVPGGPNAIAIGCPTVFIGSGGGGGGAAGGGGGEDEGGGGGKSPKAMALPCREKPVATSSPREPRPTLASSSIRNRPWSRRRAAPWRRWPRGQSKVDSPSRSGERIRLRSVAGRRAACCRPVSRDMRKRATTRKKATTHPPD